MPHRLRKHADVAAELVRLVRDDLAAALAEAHAGGSVERRVHSIRQRLKWVRSLLRVLEGAVGEDATEARAVAAGAARVLAKARDADVAAASARVLSATAGSEPEVGFDRLADTLDREAAASHRSRGPLAEVRRQLLTVAEDASRFDSDFDGVGLLNDAIATAYRRARKALKRARRSGATADLHRWRKRSKHLWHLLRLARRQLPHRARAATHQVGMLAELLGLDHDHAMLADRLALSRHDRTLPRQLAFIADRRGSMEKEAFALGAKVYAMKPRRFARRYRLKPR